MQPELKNTDVNPIPPSLKLCLFFLSSPHPVSGATHQQEAVCNKGAPRITALSGRVTNCPSYKTGSPASWETPQCQETWRLVTLIPGLPAHLTPTSAHSPTHSRELPSSLNFPAHPRPQRPSGGHQGPLVPVWHPVLVLNPGSCPALLLPSLGCPTHLRRDRSTLRLSGWQPPG